MDGSSMFFQWAMENPPAAGTYAALEELLQNDTATVGAEAQDSWSSGDSGRETPGGTVVEYDGWPSSNPPVSWHFASTMAQPTMHVEATPTAPAGPHSVPQPEPAHKSPLSRKSSVKSASSSTVTGHTSPQPSVKEHARSERKRREIMNRGFVELSAVIPGLKKMDKATILSHAVRYVKRQQEKLKEIKGRNVRSIDSVVLVKRPCDRPATTTTSLLPEIEAKISESNVMVRIHCDDRKGVLVRLLAQIEELHLSITQTNVFPCFPACSLNITIMAKVDNGFNIAPEDIVGKLEAALRQRHSEE
ncbi:unnamed protein product [Alopecurus aequalis]